MQAASCVGSWFGGAMSDIHVVALPGGVVISSGSVSDLGEGSSVTNSSGCEVSRPVGAGKKKRKQKKINRKVNKK